MRLQWLNLKSWNNRHSIQNEFAVFVGFEDGGMSYEVVFASLVCFIGQYPWELARGFYSLTYERAHGNGTISMLFLNAWMLNSQEGTLIL